jgi:small subunit ribosomal protein S8e
MARSQRRSQRKASGARYSSTIAKRKNELAGFEALTKIGDEKRVRSKRTIGGNNKRILLVTKEINVSDKKGKTSKTEVVNVLENSANSNLVRRNILTKGAIVETKLGKAKVTSRPGQEGVLNAILV